MRFMQALCASCSGHSSSSEAKNTTLSLRAARPLLRQATPHRTSWNQLTQFGAGSLSRKTPHFKVHKNTALQSHENPADTARGGQREALQ